MSNTIAHNIAKEIVYALSKKYGFDSNEAWEYALNIKEVKNAMEEISPSDASDTGSSSDVGKKIATCKKNIDLWQKKLDEGKVKDTDKHIEKIEKEKKKLEKLEGAEPKAEKKEEIKAEKDDSDSSASSESKIATCKKNIDLWQKKLDEGKVKDTDKQIEKIEKEKKKLEKLEASAPKQEPKKEEPKAEVKAEKKEKAPEKEKRIKRFSPTMSSQLKAILAEVDVEITDKLKKEFQNYIEELTDDNFKKDGFADHMRCFAKTKAPVKEEKADDVPVEETVEAEASDSDPDEDFDEIVFEGKKYVVGEKTGMVYEAGGNADGTDKPTGLKIGVGKFKNMTR